MLGCAGSRVASLLTWPQPLLFRSITVMAKAPYPRGPCARASLHPEGSVLSEGTAWTTSTHITGFQVLVGTPLLVCLFPAGVCVPQGWHL